MSAALIARLIEAGTPAALVAEVAMELGKAQSAVETVERRREKDRERKRAGAHIPRKSTELHGIRGTPRKKEIPPDPHKKNTPLNGSLKGEPIPPAETRPSRLPDDFSMPSDWLEWAMEKREWSLAEATEEAECFCRYWQAKGRDAAKRSWKKTWQNWVVTSRRGKVVSIGQADELVASVLRTYPEPIAAGREG